MKHWYNVMKKDKRELKDDKGFVNLFSNAGSFGSVTTETKHTHGPTLDRGRIRKNID